MPPVNPQGSRTALVTWTVVTSFLFVTATIFAIFFYVEASRLADQNKTLTAKYTEIVPENALTSIPEIQVLKELKGKPENNYNASQGVLEVSIERANRTAKMLAGQSAASPEDAMNRGTTALSGAQAKAKTVGVKLGTDNLVSAVNLLTDAVVQRSTEAENAKKAAADATASLTETQKNTQEQIALLTKDLDEARAQTQASAQSVTDMTAQKDTQLQQSADEINQRLNQTQEALNQARTEIATLSRQVKEKDGEVKSIQAKLSEIRPDVNKPVLRQPDGKVVRVPGGGICFIDLGSGDQIIPGMTFEVYDRIEGIPPAGDAANDDNLPRGKASLEVTRVGATSSECRIVSSKRGTAIAEGDLVANLVYDRNTKNKFLVYGNFDLAQTGKATPQDAEIMKRLVTQWGGEVVPDINVDTDFVVLGREPVIPSLTPEQREDPIEKAIYDDRAVVESEAYNNISSKARDYRIPILNQNRFLYMTGYYESAKR